MALLSLIYGSPKKTEIADIVADVTTSESHITEVEVTDNPVENGSNIADHVHFKPVSLKIEGLITDTPITSTIATIIDAITSYNDNRSRKIYDKLVDIQKAGEPITVVTGFKQYENMILKSLSVSRSSDTGAAIQYSAEFIEIRIANSETIDLALNTDPQNLGTTNLGKKATSAPTAPVVDSANQSPLASILGKLFGAA